WGDLNFRIYFDGDLCSEILNSPGTAREAKIEKPGIGRLFTSSDCNMNNDSKNNPCFQGDIIGDWREEIVVRHDDKDQEKYFLRVYTTGMSTAYSLPCLWYDHQYRQAMVWQMMAYNQPPHLSYFLGEMEGITVAPPPLTNRGRTEIAKDGTIGTSLNGKHVLICDNVHTASSFTIAEGAQPTVLTVNTPKWVQGNNDNNSITTKNDYVHTLKGAALTGTTRLTKQGGGTLRLNNAVHTYTGKTDVWGGTLEFHGTLQNSALWLNRFTTLRSSGGTFNGGITADYGSTIIPGGEQSQGSITTTTLTLNHGARLLMDVYPDLTADKVNATKLVINTKTGDNWVNYGPQYLKPVVQIAAGGTLPNGTYDLGTVGQLTGNISDIVLEGVSNATLDYADGHLLLVVGSGEPVFCTEPTIAEKTLQATAEGILLPVVDITPTAFAYHDKTAIPTTTAVFTDLAGHQAMVDITKTLYQQDFEASTNVADYWKNHNEGSSIFTPTYEGSTGQCIGIMSSNDRGNYTPITADYTGVTAYNIEFDAYFNNASKTTDFAVMSKSHFDSWIFNYGYHWKTSTSTEHNPFLLYLQRGESSTTFTVNETQNAISLSNSTWYHFVLQVDVVKGVVKYSIAKKTDGTVASSGTYALPAGESAECDGIYIRNGRYMYEPGGAGIDNIHVYATDRYEYAFTEPGTLTVTSSYEGCVPASTDCEAQFVGVRIGALGYTTLGCNYPLVVSNDELAAAGMEAAYVVTNQKVNSVTLSEVQRVPAATGLLLKGAEGTYRLPIAATTDAVASNLLHAVTSVQGYAVVTYNVYALANKADGVGFYLCAQNIVVPAGKAYMQLTGANTRSYFTFDGSMTDGISTASTDSPSAEPYYYTPAGIRVANPRKGLYISRNRKVVISR
nr:autotransporter-associated beta strand repeat-containing protein [Prevotella sp.]